MIAGRMLFFTVTARNSQGGAANATCELPTYDMTPPGGRVTEEFISTSHPNLIRASVLAIEDSKLAEEKVRCLTHSLKMIVGVAHNYYIYLKKSSIYVVFW